MSRYSGVPRSPRGAASGRSAAGLFAATGALVWFGDVHVDRLDPGQPRRGLWLALCAVLFVAAVGLATTALAYMRSERELWEATGTVGPR
jgi:hypothetical protein